MEIAKRYEAFAISILDLGIPFCSHLEKLIYFEED
jgi:hypothetical protein